LTVRRDKWNARRVVMGLRPKPSELGSVKTSREVLRVVELGIDLEYDSDKNMLRGCLSLIRHDQIMQIPPAIRGKLARADLITYRGRNRNSVLTKRGDQMLREIEEEKKKEAPI
jgi:hypothetical protein